MNAKRAGRNTDILARDLLWYFCLVSQELGVQFERFGGSGGISFSIMRGLVGDMMNRGLLWRLKDAAHRLLLGERNVELLDAGRMLDWTLGYIFHESVKLQEDAHQVQYYSQRHLNLPVDDEPRLADSLLVLEQMTDQSRESLSREIARLRELLAQARKLFCLYLAGWQANRHLARLLNDQNALVRTAFGHEYQTLIQAIYGDKPENLHLEAAASLLESGRIEQAEETLAQARVIDPDSQLLKTLSERLAGQIKNHPASRNGS